MPAAGATVGTTAVATIAAAAIANAATASAAHGAPAAIHCRIMLLYGYWRLMAVAPALASAAVSFQRGRLYGCMCCCCCCRCLPHTSFASMRKSSIW
jgi:hypothetical protein